MTYNPNNHFNNSTLLVLLLFPLFLISQNVKPVINYLKHYSPPTIYEYKEGHAQGKGFFKTYDSENGLTMDVISLGPKSAMCDKEGNLWFGTVGGGVSKYDGKSFTAYTVEHGLANSYVLSIIQDQKGNIWFGTNGGGVSKYDGRNFTTYNTTNGLAGNAVRSIVEDDFGNIWFGTNEGGVSKFDGNSFTTYTTKQGLAHNKVYCMISDQYKNIWIGTKEGVTKYDGKTFTTFSTKNGMARNEVYAMLQDSSKNIWFSNYEGEISKYDGSTFKSYNSNIGSLVNNIVCITEDSSGNIWFGSESGAIKFDGNSFIKYTTKNGLVSNRIYSITEDLSGNVWFGTDGGGISKYSGNSFTTYNSEFGLVNNSVYSIAEDHLGNIWFGSAYGGGVSKFDGKTIKVYSTKQGLTDNSIVSIFKDSKDNLWFGTTENGAIKFNGESFTSYNTKQGLSDNYVVDITEDNLGNIWFGTVSGVSKYDGEKFTTYTTKDSLDDNDIYSIMADKSGNIWIGTAKGGINKFDGISFTSHKINDKGKDYFVTTILQDSKDNIWFGTYGGGIKILNKEQLTNKGTLEFRTINKLKGLSDNAVTGIVEDKKGNVIIGTNLGISLIPLGNLDATIEVYNQFTGYPIRDVNGGTNNGTLFCDSNNNIWAGTGSHKTALVKFKYDEIHKNNTPNKVVIKKIKVKNKEVSWYNLSDHKNFTIDSTTIVQQEIITHGKSLSKKDRKKLKDEFNGIKFDSIDSFYPLPRNLILPYKYNNIEFDFLAIETDRSNLVNYKYFLKGLDKEWNPITKKTNTRFNNLYEGDYTFFLKAQNPWGVWSTPIEYSFKVLPPWYRTWWSYILYIAFFIFSIKYMLDEKTKKMKVKQEKLQYKIDKATREIKRKNIELTKNSNEKTAMLKEIHHRVKNNLQIVNSLLRLQSREVEDENVITMFKEVQNRVLSMALLHENMYQSENLKDIDAQQHITLLVKDLIKTYSIKRKITLDLFIENISLDADTLIPLGLIINEIITNSLKYAFEKRNEGIITVHLTKGQYKNYCMIIGDNGIGLKQNEDSKGLGNKLIRIFTKQLSGSITRLDEPGTMFEIIFNNTEHN